MMAVLYIVSDLLGSAFELALLLWFVGCVLTLPAIVFAAIACRKRAQNPLQAVKSLRRAFIVGAIAVAGLVTELAALILRLFWEMGPSSPGSQFGGWMFQFAITSVLWGVLLLIRKKLITPPASGGS